MTQEALKKMQWHVLTQAQYDALGTKNANDVYAIVDDKGDYTETKLNKMVFNVMSADTYKALETKDPNQIYYVTGENEIIEHKSWTDGSQTSLTPAGFVDNGYRRLYMENLDDDGNRIDWSTDPSVYGAVEYQRIYSSISSEREETVDQLLTDAGISHINSTICMVNGDCTIGSAFDWSKKISMETYFHAYVFDISSLTKLDYFYELKYYLYESVYGGDGTVTDGSTSIRINALNYNAIVLYTIDDDGNKVARIFMTNTTDNTSDAIGYISGTIFPYLGAYKNAYLAFYFGKWVKAASTVNDTAQAEVVIHPTDAFWVSGNVTSQTNDYNAITTELTARGNTITSLNTQGQNLVSAYNNLADKYNTAGIIVTED